MAEQYAKGNHDIQCNYCGSYVEKKTHSICKNCGKPILKWDV